jgi:rubrerythrin
MKPTTTGGMNRTGIATAPELAGELMDAASQTVPSARGDAEGMAAVRVAYAKGGEPAGTMPPPRATNGRKKAAGEAGAVVFLDKLGERLAFERSGVRLYDALLSKLDAFGSWKGGPTREDLEEIREDEREHFVMLAETLSSLGGDPTAITPSANASAVATKGLPALLADPRSDLRQGLEAILVAELVDNDCWENLIDLARALGQEELAGAMDQALEEERDHLRRVREWVTGAVSAAATGKIARPTRDEAARRQSTDGGRSASATRSRDTGRKPKRRTSSGSSKTRTSGGSHAGKRQAARGTRRAAGARKRRRRS